MNDKNITVAILAGGKSSRMKQDKANLIYKDKKFMKNIIDNMKTHFNVVISHNKLENYSTYEVNKVVDIFEEIGPLGGIYSVLQNSNTNNTFFVSCDTPNINPDFIKFLSNNIDEGFDAIVPVSRSGKKFPTVAIYNKSVLPVIKKHIENKNYRLMSLLDSIKTKYLYLDYTIFEDSILTNVNTKEDYESFLRQNTEPKILAISGIKNSGKTTLISRIIPLLRNKGIKVATIKHDGHNFDCDVLNTDTYKHFNSGAVGSAIFSKDKYFIVKNESVTENYLKNHFLEVDLIILEGFKHSQYNKIEVIRKGISTSPICSKEGLLAIASNSIMDYEDIPIYNIDDIQSISNLIFDYVKQ